MVCTADEMMAGRGEEAEEEEGGVHVQGGQYFGTGSYVSSYHASIQTLFIRCSAVLSFLSTSPPALFVQRARLLSAIQRRRHNIIQLS